MAPRRKPQAEKWDTAQVAAYLGVTEASARSQLARWEIEPVARQPGRSGRNIYLAAQVRAKHESRSGKGHRTDLNPKPSKET